jgi:hypothetical protein
MRWAKANQPKEHKELTFEDRFLDLMSQHKEDIARRLAEAHPVEVERVISELRESRDKHAEALKTLQQDLGGQLAEAKKTIAHLRKARAAQEQRIAELLKGKA